MQPHMSAPVAERPRTKDARYREILAVLARHGIGAVENEIVERGSERQKSQAEHLRRACEELGTVFIKLGQMLSTRGDLLPEAYRTELAKLEDDVPPLPEAAISAVIQHCLKAPPNEIFASFDPRPMGSASIGQVHAAQLPDGCKVVVKVLKPGVVEVVKLDLEILADLIAAWSPRFQILEQFDAPGLVREFSDSVLSELDYRREAANESLFVDMFANQRGFKIPYVIQEFSSEHVITHQRIDGKKPSDIANLPKAGREAIAQRIVRFLLKPAFERGVFYADPHAGNLLIQEDGSLGVIDFGKVGRLTSEARRRIADIFVAIGERDSERLTDRLIEVTAPNHPVDRALIVVDVDRLLEKYVEVSFEKVALGDALTELVQLLRNHRMRLPANLANFFKALGMAEGILQEVYPDASLAEYLKPLAAKLAYEEFPGDKWPERLRDSAIDAAELVLELPKRIDRVLGAFEQGNLRVWARIEDADPLAKRLEHIVERANATILAAACIIAIAVVLQFYHPQGWQQWLGAVFWIAVAAVVLVATRTLLGLRK